MTAEHRSVSFWQKFSAYRYSYLFSSLLLLFIITPIIDDRRNFFLPVFFLLLIGGVVRTLDISRRQFRMILGLAVLGSLFQYAARVTHVTTGDIAKATVLAEIALGAYMLFLALSIMALTRTVFSTRTVTWETIKGGISAYLLIGILWTFAYEFLILMDPESLVASRGEIGLAQLQYFSFVTLTTLGYGDITPVTWLTRNLAVLEALIGQIFLTVLIARLVGLHTTSPSDS